MLIETGNLLLLCLSQLTRIFSLKFLISIFQTLIILFTFLYIFYYISKLDHKNKISFWLFVFIFVTFFVILLQVFSCNCDFFLSCIDSTLLEKLFFLYFLLFLDWLKVLERISESCVDFGASQLSTNFWLRIYFRRNFFTFLIVLLVKTFKAFLLYFFIFSYFVEAILYDFFLKFPKYPFFLIFSIFLYYFWFLSYFVGNFFLFTFLALSFFFNFFRFFLTSCGCVYLIFFDNCSFFFDGFRFLFLI